MNNTTATKKIQKQHLLLLILAITISGLFQAFIQKQHLLLLISQFENYWHIIIFHSKTTFVTVNHEEMNTFIDIGSKLFKNNICYC